MLSKDQSLFAMKKLRQQSATFLPLRPVWLKERSLSGEFPADSSHDERREIFQISA
ncbi:hypothetical protein LNO36_00430 [Klebsiella variicola subsp. variicola]|nr:hypothetical protein [Klebsiella variicola subsp. variicola]